MKKLSLIVLATFLTSVGLAQSPEPVVVQAAATPVSASARPATPGNASSLSASLKQLQDLKAANEEMIQKQAATLQVLDELLKGAEQLRIYSKRS